MFISVWHDCSFYWMFTQCAWSEMMRINLSNPEIVCKTYNVQVMFYSIQLRTYNVICNLYQLQTYNVICIMGQNGGRIRIRTQALHLTNIEISIIKMRWSQDHFYNLHNAHLHTWKDYHHTSNIRCTLVGNKIVDHSDVVGASPVHVAPTTSSFSTWQLVSMDWAKTTARRDENHLSFGIWCNLY